jgi:RNA polymerase sigma-70 factor, ECF subfamily
MEADDAAIVANVLAGNRDAFRTLVERHSRTVFSLGYRMMGNESDAEDVVQETFLRAYKKLDSFQFQASFKTWIYRIASNYCMDTLAKRKHENPMPATESADEESLEIDVPSMAAGPDRLVLSGEIQHALGAALETLTPVERTAFVLRHFEGCSIEEIKKALNLRESAAKNSIFRAVQKIRKSLAPLVVGAAQ